MYGSLLKGKILMSQLEADNLLNEINDVQNLM